MAIIEVCYKFFECDKIDKALKLPTKDEVKKEITKYCDNCSDYKPRKIGRTE